MTNHKKKGSQKDPSNGVKGGHSSQKSPSSLAKHQKGDARRKEDQVGNPNFKAAKAKGSILSKGALAKQQKQKEKEKLKRDKK